MKNIGAFVVGDTNSLATPIFHVAQDAGFSRVSAYKGLSLAKQQIERTPICFFLCAEVINPIVLSPILNQIRSSSRRRIRFAPIVYFCESPSRDTIALCAALGFDDILTTPFTAKRVNQRLKRLIQKPQKYVETDDYLGPRNGPVSATGRARTASPHSRTYQFIRDVDAGIIILRDQKFGGVPHNVFDAA